MDGDVFEDADRVISLVDRSTLSAPVARGVIVDESVFNGQLAVPGVDAPSLTARIV